jgi:hypothetical protein
MKLVWRSIIGFGAVATMLLLARRGIQPPAGLLQAETVQAWTQAGPAAEPESGPNPSHSVPFAAVPRDPTARGDAPIEARILPAADVLWKKRAVEPEFAAFQDWVLRFEASDEGKRAELAGEGLRLARVRREEMKGLIQSDPRRALELSVPSTVRERLPEEVRVELESRVEGVGDFEVLAAIGLGQELQSGSSIRRNAVLGGQRYPVSTYGSRQMQPTQFGVPLHGIALEGQMALAESPIRRLEKSEIAVAVRETPDPVCSVNGIQLAAVAGDDTGIGRAGDERIFTCGTAHLEEMAARMVQLASESESTDANGAPRSKRAYTEGTKRVIFIRVDFSDLVGEPFSNITGTNLMTNLDAFFRQQSYHRTGFAPFATNGSAMTPTIRMPNTAAYYGARDAAELRTAARTAATAAGYNLTSYSFDAICFGSVPGFAWAGLAYVGAPGCWIRASFDTAGGVIAHELGHNYGLFHANFWDTGGESIIGSGSNIEYGDSFDTMGNASAGRRHFNTRYKNYLDWLPNTYVRNVLTNGTYRLSAMDSTNDVTSVRALTVRRNSRTNYWLEVRQLWTANTWVQNGVGIRWGQTGNTTSLLLDTTPGSADGKNDSPLVLGRTFSDRAAGVHLTTLAKGGTDPVWFDVAVRFGNPTNNQPPSVAVSGSAATAALNATVRFTATASDSDDSQLAYAWDFGDGSFGTNGPAASKAYATAGEYVVRCVVSDLRGGIGSDSYLVRVGSPTTVRLSGKVTRDGQPVEGVRIYTANTKQTYTDSDGTYILAGLARGSYTVRALAEDLLFTRQGFTNPINLQANRAEVNFEASAPGDLMSLTLVPLGAEWRFYDKGTLPLGGWTSTAFNDSGWSQGAAQLGYGDDDVVTTVSFGPNSAAKYITTWFRHAFTVEDPKAFLSATLGLIRDDGAVVYLNGREVFRSNMPTGTIGASTLASATVGGTDESTIFETDLDPTLFVTGRNVLAVEVHQSDAASSDLSFQLQLTGLLQPVRDPSILTSIDAGQLKLSWPLAAVGFAPVQAPGALGPWTDVDEPVRAAGGQNVLVVPLTAESRFYRLERR